MEYLVYFLPLAFILICWLIARNMLMKDQLRDLESRVQQLEETDRPE